MTLDDIMHDSKYDMTQFAPTAREELLERTETRKDKTGEVLYVECLVRHKAIKLKPEEVVRQLYLAKLHNDYGYSYERMSVEYPVNFGREVRRADIVIMDKDEPTVPFIVIELKKPQLRDGKEQLRSYCNATGAPIGVWTNGSQISYYHRKDRRAKSYVENSQPNRATAFNCSVYQ